MIRPQGAPRGLLVCYILHRISKKPSSGYEILKDIEMKTNGAWRPGAGSIYPMLKKLLAKGLLRVEKSGEKGEDGKVFAITEKGLEYLEQVSQGFMKAASKWGDVRGLFIELVQPRYFSTFFLEGARSHFRIAQEFFESKEATVPKEEAEYVLKEYRLELEKQLLWTKQKLRNMEKR